MIELVLFIITMGLLDSLNPFSIGLQIVLLPIAKKTYHTLFYILGTFCTYFVGGLLIYFGVNEIFGTFLSNISIDFTKSPYIYIELGLGIILLLFSIYNTFKKQNKDNKKENANSVKPWALFLLGASGTIFDLPTAIPYLAVLSKMISMNLNLGLVILLLVFYCLIYLLPMIVIYIIYLLARKKAESILLNIKLLFEKVSKIAALIFSFIISIFLIIDALLSITGNPILF